MCVPCARPFSPYKKIWPRDLDLGIWHTFEKNSTLDITFNQKRLSYCMCLLLVAIPFARYQNFDLESEEETIAQVLWECDNVQRFLRRIETWLQSYDFQFQFEKLSFLLVNSMERNGSNLIMSLSIKFLVPYRLARGLLVCSPSVSPSVTLQFSRPFSAVFWDIDLKFGIWICHNTDQVQLSSHLTYFYRSYCPLLKFSFPDFFSAVFWDIDLKFGIWICRDIIPIKFDFCCSWPTFTGVIAFVAVMHLENLLGPVGDFYCLRNTFRMLVYLQNQMFKRNLIINKTTILPKKCLWNP